MASNVTTIEPTKPKVTGDEGFDKEKRRIQPKQVSSPVKVYTSNLGRKRAPSLHWEAPEWDLAECGRIIDTESFVRRAFTVKEALFTKAGWELTGQRPERVAYIKKRLQQMEHAGGTPFPILLLWTVSSLTRMHNAFWVKKRDKKASGGGPRTKPGTNGARLDPVAAYFPLPAETVRFKRDEYGRVKKYKQDVPGKEEVTFNPEDVIHFFFDKREGFSVGTPSLVPVKDDIRALRRIEEHIELLVQAHLFPLYHYKVGTPEAPAMMFPDGTSEVEIVQNEVANIPSDGCWVTPERHEIEVKGAGGEALDVDEILNYFKQRVFIGLGVSSVDMGEGGTANRSTAQTMSRNLIERTKAEQRILESFIDKFIIEELMLESSFPKDTLFDEENLVHFVFKEIDNEARQALENHASQMYMQNSLTHGEMRDAIGREPFTPEDWEDTYWKQVDEPTKLMQSLDEPYSPEAKAVARANTTSIQEPDLKEAQSQKEKERKEELAAKKQTAAKKPQALQTRASSVNKAGQNKNKPRNQHGTRSSTKLNKDFYDSYNQNPQLPTLDPIFAQKPPVRYTYMSLQEDIVRSVQERGWDADRIQAMIGTSFERAKELLIAHAKKAYRTGINDTGVAYWDVRLAPTDAKIERHVKRYTDKLRDELFRNIKRQVIGAKELKSQDAISISVTMDALLHRARMIDESEVMRAYNAGKADGYKVQGVENITVSRHGSQPCEICDNSTLRWTESDAIIYEDLPPLHPLCTCVLDKTQK